MLQSLCIQRHKVHQQPITLRASEAAAQCIVFGPVCGCVCLFVCYHGNSASLFPTSWVVWVAACFHSRVRGGDPADKWLTYILSPPFGLSWETRSCFFER